MLRSESVDQIAPSLARARLDFEAVKKSHLAQVRSERGAYTYRYEKLADVLDAVDEPLAKNGITVVQTVVDGDAGRLQLQTTLLHSSGQWIAGRVPLAVAPNAPAQAFGSALTYMRRYGLEGLLGIAGEDDDGQQASKAPPPRPTPSRTAERPPPVTQGQQTQAPAQPAAQERMREPGDDEHEDPGVLSALRRDLDSAAGPDEVVGLIDQAKKVLDARTFESFRSEASARYKQLRAA